jgi:starch synthase
MAAEYRGSVFFVNRMDENLAHNIYAASDMFLMPSRFEPCGLGQLLALKYGTIVIATKTGGLADTVSGFGESKKPNGFFTNILTTRALSDSLNAAFISYHNKPLWYNMIKNAMEADFSWDKSAQQYEKILNKLITGKGKVKNAVK